MSVCELARYARYDTHCPPRAVEILMRETGVRPESTFNLCLESDRYALLTSRLTSCIFQQISFVASRLA